MTKVVSIGSIPHFLRTDSLPNGGRDARDKFSDVKCTLARARYNIPIILREFTWPIMGYGLLRCEPEIGPVVREAGEQGDDHIQALGIPPTAAGEVSETS
jgi:hypothetical protein